MSDLADEIVSERNAISGMLASGVTDSPDNAARALQLAKSSGVPAPIIDGDLEGFEKQHRSDLASQLLRANPVLADYVQANPLAAKLSGDDFGNLDETTSAVKKLGPRGALGTAVDWYTQASANALEAGIGGFKAGYKFDEQSHEIDELLASPAMQYLKYTPIHTGVLLGGVGFDTAMRAFTGATVGLAAGVAEGVESLGLTPILGGGRTKESLIRDLVAGANVATAGEGSFIRHTVATHEFNALAREAKHYGKTIEPWTEVRREPPVGLEPFIDEVKAEQAKIDVDNLLEVTKIAQQSLTRDRSPEMFRDLVARSSDQEIGISADAVRALYGDKPPAPDDGLLGFVPRLAEQLASAEAYGGDVKVPLADWLAHVDPAVAREIKDFVRVRQDGMTLAEAKLPKTERPAWGDPVDDLRSASGLEPMLMAPQAKLGLRRLGEGKEFSDVGPGRFHDFEFADETGKAVGYIIINESVDGKTLYVEDVQATLGERGAMGNVFGSRTMRDLLRQLKEEFPNAESLTGHRVSGAREAAGKVDQMPMAMIKLDDPGTWNLRNLDQLLEGGEWLDINKAEGLRGYFKRPEALRGRELELARKIDEMMRRLVPKDVTFGQMARIEDVPSGREVGGVYQQFRDKLPVIVWSLTGDGDPVGSARHEAIHHLRQQGFFSHQEWAELSRIAKKEGWLEKYNIERRYRGLPEGAKIEEAVAEAFAEWRSGKRPAEGLLAEVFQRLQQLLEEIRHAVNEFLGREMTADEIFEMVESGRVGRREAMGPMDPNAFRAQRQEKQLSFLNEVTRMEDREIFDRASAVGMTVANYRRYMKLIEKLRSEDEAKQLRDATAAEAKRQTKEWKENRAEMHKQVSAELRLRPDWQADQMIQDGLRLDADALTDEQKAALPRRYYNQAENAVSPNVVADIVGYQTGTDLVDGLIAFAGTRTRAKMQPMEFTRRLIDIETDARMEAKYGNLEKNILEEAKEHVLSETQLDLLHEETLALASQAGVQLSIPKDALVSQIKEGFAETRAAQVDSSEYLAAVGRAGKAVEEALLKGDAQEAFRQKQKQFIGTTYAREAAKFEREQVKFAKLADRYSRREGPKNVDRPFIDHIQSLLLSAGFDVRRSPGELAEARGMSGFANLDSFVEFNRDLGWEPAVTDAIQAGQLAADWHNANRPLDGMTVEEWREFRDAVQSLDHIGKAVRKIEVAGRAVDFEEWKGEVIANIKEHFGLRPDLARLEGGRYAVERLRTAAFRYDAQIVRMEEVMKDLDGRKDAGPLFSALIRPMAESKHTEYSMLEDLTRKLKALRGADKKWRKTLDDTIPHDFLIDPLDSTPFDLNRGQMINIMLNWGNESNIKKFTQGYFGKEYALWGQQKLDALFEKHATKEDWDFVQNIWDIFKGWEPAIKKLYYDTSGVPPKLIDAREVATPHGTYRGGYFPIIYDQRRSSIGVVQDRSPVTDKGTFARDYFRSTTGNGYTKARTGYVDYVEFATTLDQVGSRMQQMIHDIAYRRAVIDGTKIIYDRELRAAIKNYYGLEYEKQLNPWLKDIANHFNQNEDATKDAVNFFRRLRYNLMGHALGLSLKVLGSPDVGLLNPIAVARVIRNYDENVGLAWEKSKEIPHTFRNMDRDFRENLERIVADNKLDQWSSDAVRFAFYPVVKVSQGFRIATWVQEYHAALERGLDDGAASAHADSIVRERHGSAGLPDLPAAMRSTEALKWTTLFYGYFNTMYNWQRQIPGQIRRGEWMEAAKTTYGAVGIGAAFGALLFNQMRESDTWYGTIAKALALQVTGTLWVAREAFNYLIEGFPSRTPFNNVVNAAGATINDVRKLVKKQPVEKPVQHAANVVGLTTGLPLGQLGRTSQFLYDVNRGKQRPRNVMEWTRGIIHGEARLKP